MSDPTGICSGNNQFVLRSHSITVPALVLRAGGNARFAYAAFLRASMNKHKRYLSERIVRQMLMWCETSDLELRQITPRLASDYLNQLEGAVPVKNQALVVLRRFFDALVLRKLLPMNSFAFVPPQVSR